MKISILDCTLRDGGYINDWNFGQRAIKSIIYKLEETGIEIIECGFLRDKPYNPDRSVFCNLDQMSALMPSKKQDTMYVGMIALGDISDDKIPPCDGSSIDGIRLTFHKEDWEEADHLAISLIGKGYKVFFQPVGITSYNDTEVLELISKVNILHPYAFYLVDTLGMMYQNELLRLFYLADNNLHSDITIGYHPHNNLQLAFSNAQALMRIHSKRHIILDTSVYGMGRGAGNLCTELVAHYVNENSAKKYDVLPLMEIVDEFLTVIYKNTPWGYSTPYYLAAIGGIHPNYASYLLNKQTISVRAISTILELIPAHKRDMFDRGLIEDIYISYQSNEIDDSESSTMLQQFIGDRKVLILAPGNSILSRANELQRFILDNDPFIISINFLPQHISVGAVFISNTKRFDSISEAVSAIDTPVFVTSNIHLDVLRDNVYPVNYSSLIGHGNESDNAGTMLLRYISKIGINEVFIAGFDGFSLTGENYYQSDLNNSVERATVFKKNEAIGQQLSLLGESMELKFITPSIYAQKES